MSSSTPCLPTHPSLRSAQIQPGIVSHISRSPIPFRQMENIGQYISACAHLGVASQDLFTSTDLFEGRNLVAVVHNLHALGRIAKKLGFKGPSIEARPAPKSPHAPRCTSGARGAGSWL